MSSIPTSANFADRITRISLTAAPGPDEVLGKARTFAPHWMKCQLYRLLVKRWCDVQWTVKDIPTRREFALRGVNKVTNLESLEQFRWLGILDAQRLTAKKHAIPVILRGQSARRLVTSQTWNVGGSSYKPKLSSDGIRDA